jgi:hypothetical protein
MDWGTFWASVVASGALAAAVSGIVAVVVSKRESHDRQDALALEREKWETLRKDDQRQRLAALQTPQLQRLHETLDTTRVDDPFGTYRADPLAMFQWRNEVSDAMAPLVLHGDHPLSQAWRGVKTATDAYVTSARESAADLTDRYFGRERAREAMRAQVLVAIKELHES